MSEATETIESTKLAYVIRSVDKDRRSHGGFHWPESGPVEAPDFVANTECGAGLHGLLNGIGDWSLTRCEDVSRIWQVVAVDSATIIELDGKVKFPRGEVIYSGPLPGAMKLIAGKRLLTLAAKEPSTAGYGAPALTTGDRAPASTTGDHAPASTTGDYAPASTTGYGAPASTAGDYAPASTAGDYAPASTTGKNSVAACLGGGGRAKCGELGSIILTRWDESAKRHRHTVGYAGEGGIEPGVWYVLDGSGVITRGEDQS